MQVCLGHDRGTVLVVGPRVRVGVQVDRIVNVRPGQILCVFWRRSGGWEDNERGAPFISIPSRKGGPPCTIAALFDSLDDAVRAFREHGEEPPERFGLIGGQASWLRLEDLAEGEIRLGWTAAA